MKQITDQDLILHYYGESADNEAIEQELERSADVAARFDELRSVLDAVRDVDVEAPHVGFEERLWRQLEPQLQSRRWFALPWSVSTRRWLVTAAAATLLLVTFLAGRFSVPLRPEPSRLSPSQKILVVSVADHLARTELLLLEIANAGEGSLDISNERHLAGSLSRANRLYRQTSRRQGDLRTVSLLDDLELILLEIAHSSDVLLAKETAELRRRLDEGDLLFKIQAVRARLEHSGARAGEQRVPTSV